MALTKKQVRQLRAMANQLKPLVQIGKGDLSDNVIKQADETIEKRELIKVQVLDGSGIDAKEAAQGLADRMGAEVVQVIATVPCSTVVHIATTSSTSSLCANRTNAKPLRMKTPGPHEPAFHWHINRVRRSAEHPQICTPIPDQREVRPSHCGFQVIWRS